MSCTHIWWFFLVTNVNSTNEWSFPIRLPRRNRAFAVFDPMLHNKLHFSIHNWVSVAGFFPKGLSNKMCLYGFNRFISTNCQINLTKRWWNFKFHSKYLVSWMIYNFWSFHMRVFMKLQWQFMRLSSFDFGSKRIELCFNSFHCCFVICSSFKCTCIYIMKKLKHCKHCSTLLFQICILSMEGSDVVKQSLVNLN